MVAPGFGKLVMVVGLPDGIARKTRCCNIHLNACIILEAGAVLLKLTLQSVVAKVTRQVVSANGAPRRLFRREPV